MKKEKTITRDELRKWIESNPERAIDAYLSFRVFKYNDNKPLKRIILKRLEADFKDKASIVKLIHGLIERSEKINIKHLSNLYSWSRLFDKQKLFLKVINSIIKDDIYLASKIIPLEIFYKNKITENERAQKRKAKSNFQGSLNKTEIDNLQNKLKDWIRAVKIEKFVSIEKELFEKGFIDSSHKWVAQKTELADFAYIIIHYKYFEQSVNRKRIKDFHKRQFISERYGFPKTGSKSLGETWKSSKPNFESANKNFPWIIESY